MTAYSLIDPLVCSGIFHGISCDNDSEFHAYTLPQTLAIRYASARENNAFFRTLTGSCIANCFIRWKCINGTVYTEEADLSVLCRR